MYEYDAREGGREGEDGRMKSKMETREEEHGLLFIVFLVSYGIFGRRSSSFSLLYWGNGEEKRVGCSFDAFLSLQMEERRDEALHVELRAWERSFGFVLLHRRVADIVFVVQHEGAGS